VLMGAAALLMMLLGTAAIHSLLAGCPDGWSESDLSCLFVPTRGDVGVHLLSYALMAMILVGISSVLISGRRQWAYRAGPLSRVAIHITKNRAMRFCPHRPIWVLQ